MAETEEGLPDPKLQEVYGHRLLTISSEDLHDRWRKVSDVQDRISNRYENAFRVAVKETQRDVRNRIFRDLYDAVASGKPLSLETWMRIAGRTLMRNTRQAVGATTLDAMIAGVNNNMGGPLFDLAEYQEALPQNKIEEFSNIYTSRVVYYMNDTSYKGMRRFLNVATDKGRTKNTIGKMASRLLGLDERWVNASENYRSLLEDQDKPKSLIERVWGSYVDRAIDQRSELFGQTETMTAINFGQQMLFENMRRDGKLPDNVRKVWVTAVDERVCPICEPMDKRTVRLESQFTTKSGKVIVPPVHPRCRCTIIPDVFLGTLGEEAAVIRARTRGAAA